MDPTNDNHNDSIPNEAEMEAAALREIREMFDQRAAVVSALKDRITETTRQGVASLLATLNQSIALMERDQSSGQEDIALTDSLLRRLQHMREANRPRGPI